MQIVSWGELTVGLVVLTIFWYGYIVLRYYRGSIKDLGKGKRADTAQVRWRRETLTEDTSQTIVEHTAARSSNTHAQVHELMQELKLVFAAALRDQLSKEQILEAIGIRLAKYTTLPGEIKASFSQHIVNEFSLQLKMVVTIEEMNALW